MKMMNFKILLCILINFLVSTASYPDSPDQRQNQRLRQLNYPALSRDTNKTSGPDTLLSQSWGLTSIGFFDVFTPLAQPISPNIKGCSDKIVVAVVDTGIDYNHIELQNNLWINKGETGEWKGSLECNDKSCNGIDDDGNGFIDDVIGWDFVHEVPLPYDTHGHGTHVSGIIAGSSANGFGSMGICSTASIMALKYYDNSGMGYNNSNNTVRAFQYAIKMGANIINYSAGGADPVLAERIAIEDGQQNNVLFVVAAGNDGHNSDQQPYFPASYHIDNVISVASITQRDTLLPSSNFGHTVSVAAPGLSILSSLPGERFGTMTGTSQATAFVTGTAALLESQYVGKKVDYRKIKRLILEGARTMPNNENHSLVSSGLLSVSGSIKMIQKEKKK